MNPFFDIANRARDNSPWLAHLTAAQRAYLASPAFREQIEFKGEEGRKTKLKVLHYILRVTALHPDTDAVQNIERGLASFDLFGVGMPVYTLDMALTAEEQVALRDAIAANLASPMSKAARLTRRGRERNAADRQFVSALQQQKIASLPFSTPAQYKANREAARELDNTLQMAVDDYTNAVRLRRQNRRAAVARAATPGAESWLHFLLGIAVATLIPA